MCSTRGTEYLGSTFRTREGGMSCACAVCSWLVLALHIGRKTLSIYDPLGGKTPSTKGMNCMDPGYVSIVLVHGMNLRFAIDFPKWTDVQSISTNARVLGFVIFGLPSSSSGIVWCFPRPCWLAGRLR